MECQPRSRSSAYAEPPTDQSRVRAMQQVSPPEVGEAQRKLAEVIWDIQRAPLPVISRLISPLIGVMTCYNSIYN